MKQRISLIVATLAVMFGFVMFVAVPAMADTKTDAKKDATTGPVNVLQGDACTGNTSVCDSGGGNKLFDIIKNVINLLLYASGIIAVIMIVIGGINYVLSAGDSSKVVAAKNTVLYAVVGLIVAALAYAAVNFIVASLF